MGISINRKWLIQVTAIGAATVANSLNLEEAVKLSRQASQQDTSTAQPLIMGGCATEEQVKFQNILKSNYNPI